MMRPAAYTNTSNGFSSWTNQASTSAALQSLAFDEDEVRSLSRALHESESCHPDSIILMTGRHRLPSLFGGNGHV